MKHIFTFFTVLMIGLSAYLMQNAAKMPLKIPAAPLIEGGEMRRAWEKMRLADPLTGEIPQGAFYAEREFAKHLPKGQEIRGAVGVWESRGPWNVGGRTRALAIDVTNENRMFAGGVSGGLWKTEDAGNTWTRVTPLNAHPSIVSITQDTRPGKTNNWYYLSGEMYGTSASGGGAFYLGDGAFKSTDGGNTWTPINSTAGGVPSSFTNYYQTGWRIISYPHPDTSVNMLFMACMANIYKSTNGGTSWTVSKGGGTTATSYFTDIATTTTGVLYATFSSDGPSKGLWRSENGGVWVNIKPANFPMEYDRIVIGINPNNENEVYFLGQTPNAGFMNHYISSDDWNSLWKYTYVSGDGTGAGGIWEDLSLNLPSTGTQFDKFASQGGYDLMVKVQPGTGNVFIGGTSLWRSTDGFATGNNTTHIGGYKPGTDLPYFELYPEHHPDLHDVLFLPSNPNVMVSASDGGVRTTPNCNAANVVWESKNNGYLTSQLYTVIIDKNAVWDNFLGAGLQDNASFVVNSTSPTAPWKMTINGDGAYGAIAQNHTDYYFSIQQGKIAKCNLDANNNVTGFQRIDPIGGKEYQFINQFVLDPNDDNFMYVAGGRKVWRNDALNSIQINNEWDSISTGWTAFPDTIAINPNPAQQELITAIAVSQSPANRLYYGTNKGKLFRILNANTGTPSATQITITGAGQGFINCIYIDPTNANNMFVVFSNYNMYSLFYTDNQGTTWQKVAGNLESSLAGTGDGPSLRWASILTLPGGAKKYFVGTSVGLYSADALVEHTSSNPGTQWVQEGANVIGEVVVDMIECRNADGFVAVATHGNGMFTTNFIENVGIQTPINVTAAVSAYPNPAKDLLNFGINNLKMSAWQVEIMDIQGKVLKSQDFMDKNKKTLTVAVGDLPAGMYLYRLTGDKMQASGKVVIQ